LSAGAIVLAAAVPLLFLHVEYQPSLGAGLGSTTVDATLSDLAVLVVVATAICSGISLGFAPLRGGLAVLLAAGLLLGWIWLSIVFPLLRDHPYAWQDHAVTAAKFAEYALLAVSVPLLLRSIRDVRLVLGSLVVWSTAATAFGLLQFVGLVDEFEGRRPWQREPSFLGIHDLAALSAAVLAIALLELTLQPELMGRRWARLAGATGGVGIVLSGAVAAVLGIGLAAVFLGVLAWRRGRLTYRRAAALCGIVVVIAVATGVMRGSAIADVAGFLGLRDDDTPAAVETYAQRTLLAYLGLRIFLDEPLTGAGWQGSADEWAFGPHLADARRRFPSEPEEAFPSADRKLGVQNAYVQTLADLGAVGLVLLLGLLGASMWTALSRASRSAVPVLGMAMVLVAAGVWNGLGLVAGIPLDALTWLALGLVLFDG
jgi:O-antigen ligase